MISPSSSRRRRPKRPPGWAMVRTYGLPGVYRCLEAMLEGASATEARPVGTPVRTFQALARAVFGMARPFAAANRTKAARGLDRWRKQMAKAMEAESKREAKKAARAGGERR